MTHFPEIHETLYSLQMLIVLKGDYLLIFLDFSNHPCTTASSLFVLSGASPVVSAASAHCPGDES